MLVILVQFTEHVAEVNVCLQCLTVLSISLSLPLPLVDLCLWIPGRSPCAPCLTSLFPAIDSLHWRSQRGPGLHQRTVFQSWWPDDFFPARLWDPLARVWCTLQRTCWLFAQRSQSPERDPFPVLSQWRGSDNEVFSNTLSDCVRVP